LRTGLCPEFVEPLNDLVIAILPVVCNPRKNSLLKAGNKSDRIDARKLAELLRGNHLKSVYHGETGVRTLRELARSYLTTSKDLTRVMSRVKALYRSWAIPCAGRNVYYTRHRNTWLGKIPHAGVRRRAEHLYQHMDILKQLRQQARRELLAESCKHTITAKLRQIPSLGPIRSALLVAEKTARANAASGRCGDLDTTVRRCANLSTRHTAGRRPWRLPVLLLRVTCATYRYFFQPAPRWHPPECA